MKQKKKQLCIFKLKALSLSHFTVDHWNELKRQLDRERDIKCEEATREFNNVKLDVESRRCDLEAMQKNVEAVVAEVLVFVII